MKKFLKWIFYVFVGLMVIGYFAGKNDDTKTSSSTSQASQSSSANASENAEESPTQKPIYQTTARKLFNDYEENEVAVDEQLKGKIVAMTGIVQSIDKDFTDSIIISLKTDNEFMPARLKMKDSQKAAAIALKKGKQVVIMCENMSRIIGAPSGRNCSFN
ncbi:OB-fold protein [Pantoea agglomerans]|uniref:OB-fold protein n=1 Tax=Enterobacter agglomerans TaxID=549 RepID=UPI003208B91E